MRWPIRFFRRNETPPPPAPSPTNTDTQALLTELLTELDVDAPSYLPIDEDTPTRWQHYLMAHMILPRMAYDDPAAFLALVNHHDCDVQLTALWESVGSEMKPAERVSPAGISCDLQQYRDHDIAIITFPEPQKPPEIYLAAFVVGPMRELRQRLSSAPTIAETVAAFKQLPAHYYTLEMSDTTTGDFRTTMFCEWTPEPAHLNYGNGPEPETFLFYRHLCAVIDGKLGRPLGAFVPDANE